MNSLVEFSRWCQLSDDELQQLLQEMKERSAKQSPYFDDRLLTRIESVEAIISAATMKG